ncbi:UNVERIFIED_CONTAM: hypothetical protein Sangu_2814900 [Sesamum angustifolium]|uniref:Uncharacterized protein n=1 Tax=Sesamum angustifolium TaxID=2727405 RepID=A0AAW2IS80_9LAMI
MLPDTATLTLFGERNGMVSLLPALLPKLLRKRTSQLVALALPRFFFFAYRLTVNPVLCLGAHSIEQL